MFHMRFPACQGSRRMHPPVTDISGTILMVGQPARGDCYAMNWKSIRLELAKTDGFPRGSPGRAYLLRLPLGEDGAIDKATLEQQPRQATVRRFWPSEPDQVGYALPARQGLELTSDLSENGAQTAKLESDALRLDERVTLTEPDGTRLLFLVAALEPLV